LREPQLQINEAGFFYIKKQKAIHMNARKMILRLCVSIALFVFISSCHDDDPNEDPATPSKAQLTFSIGQPISQNNNGQLSEAETPASAIITLHDASGKTVEDHRKMQLTPLNDKFVSTSLDVLDQKTLFLSEFIVLDANNNVLCATPRNGSNLAHFVNHPLDLELTMTADQLTTVNPEVVAVEHSKAEDFGYAQFGFNVVEKIEATITAFVPWNEDFQLANAHLKVEGLKDSTSTSPEVLWTYETDLDAKENVVSLKKSIAFRITITKPGFDTWNKLGGLKQGVNVKAQLSQPVDVYVAGIMWDAVYSNRAVYMKNGKVIELETTGESVATNIALQGENIYVTGLRLETDGRWKQACVWRNGTRVDMPFWGETRRVLFSEEDDLFIAGTFYANTNPNSHSTGFYLKNGFETDLAPLTPNADVKLLDIAVYHDLVFVIGYETVNNVNKPLLWKDEAVVPLPADFSPVAITIKNDIVYVAGNVGSKAAYLRDGNLITMSENSDAVDIIVTDTDDVYVLDFNGAYWKNGQKITLPGTFPAAFAFAMVDDNVYVAGTANIPVDAGLQTTMAQWNNNDKPIWGSKDVNPFSMTVIKK
jgi:hypothetical protein